MFVSGNQKTMLLHRLGLSTLLLVGTTSSSSPSNGFITKLAECEQEKLLELQERLSVNRGELSDWSVYMFPVSTTLISTATLISR